MHHNPANIDTSSIDKSRARASFERAACHYDKADVLQREVGDRMLNRLRLIRKQPHTIIDVGAGTGRQGIALMQRYPAAHIIAIDFSPAMLCQARQRQPWSSGQGLLCADAERLPLTSACVDMIFSNLTLQWCNDLDRTFNEFQRVLRPGGLVMFSTLGPDTLKELRASWNMADNYRHVNNFRDMHDVGDAMMRAQLSGVVMDIEHITLTYADVFMLMGDLKTLGAHNMMRGRTRSLTGKNRLQTMVQAYERFRRNGVLPASYEVIYGHAWKADKSRVVAREGGMATGVPLIRRGPRHNSQTP